MPAIDLCEGYVPPVTELRPRRIVAIVCRWQTKDLYKSLTSTQKAALSSMLAAVKDCKGDACP
jgi:hypothetical protein